MATLANRIVAVLDTAARHGVNTDVLNTPLTLHYAQSGARRELHVDAPEADCTTRIDERLTERLSFAELAERDGCSCIWRHTGPVGAYARLLENLDVLDELVSGLGREPDWDLWIPFHATHRRAVKGFAEILTTLEYGTAAVPTANTRARGIHLTLDPGDIATLDDAVAQHAATFDTHTAAWNQQRDSVRTWWENYLRYDIVDTYEHAVVTLHHTRAAPKIYARERAAMACYQYGLGSSTRTGYDTHLVCAPAQILELIAVPAACTIHRLSQPVEAHQAELFLELHEPGCDTDALIDTVCAAVPA